MLNYIYHTLESFQGNFSQHRTWLLFCAIIFCFMGATEMIGVTSMCRFWLQDEAGYKSLLHFF